MEKPQGKSNVGGLEVLDYKSIIRLKKLGLSHGAIAARLGCKLESVQRIVTRCENESTVWEEYLSSKTEGTS